MSELVHCKVVIKPTDVLSKDIPPGESFYDTAKRVLENAYPGVIAEPQGYFAVKLEDKILALDSIEFFIHGVVG